MGDKSWAGGVGRVRERSRVSVTIACARAAPKEGVFLALSCQAIRETFVNWLRIGVIYGAGEW